MKPTRPFQRHDRGQFGADSDRNRWPPGWRPRNNAVDKVAGWELRGGRLPLAGHVLLVSGRASFELAESDHDRGAGARGHVRAVHAGGVAGRGERPHAVGFLRGTTMNVYAGEHRVVTEDAPVAASG
jgi:FdhD protein